VVIDVSQFDKWPSLFVVEELLYQIGEAEDGSRGDDAQTGLPVPYILEPS
jgi:hypothetical protein